MLSSNIKVGLAKELITILASGDDPGSLEKGKSVLDISIDLRAKQKSELNDQLRLLAKHGDEEKIIVSQNDDTLSKTLKTLTYDAKLASSDVKDIETEIEELENKINEKKEDKKKLEGRKEEVKVDNDEVLPKTKYNFKLYTNISHIRWDYDCKDDHIGGFVACLKDVKPFNFNTNQTSKSFVVNYLWDLISSNQTD